MPRKVKFLYNPNANRGKCSSIASSLQDVITPNPNADWVATYHPNLTLELAEQAGSEGYKVVAAVGGDGTIHQVANGLMRLPPGKRPCLAAIPVGSGNDYCFNIGGQMDPHHALHRIFTGKPKEVDIGLVTDDRNRSEYWVNVLDVGFTASIAIHTYQMKYLHGFLMYLWAVIKAILRNHDAPFMTITTDQERMEGNVLMFSMGNGSREAGGFLVSPQAKPDDGILDYTLVERISRARMFRLLPEVMRGTHGQFREVKQGRFRTCRVRSESPIPIHFDGEIFADTHTGVQAIEVEILPKAIRVIT